MGELCKQFTLVWFRDFCELNSTELNRKKEKNRERERIEEKEKKRRE